MYDKETILNFYSTDNISDLGGGKIVDSDIILGEANIVTVPVTSIDSVFLNKTEYPTFIKMDIEGAEKAALRGAENTIRTYKPKLAICVYHKMEDVYKLPQLICSYRTDYQYVLHHYDANSMCETVMYAI